MTRALLLLSVLLALASPSRAASIDAQFRAWLASDLWPEASEAGVSEQTFDAAFKDVTPNLKLPDLVLPGQAPKVPDSQHQAEFRTPSAYFSEKAMGPVVAGGRARLKQNAAVLRAVEQRFGVPGPVLLAVWGRETGYGAAKLPYDAFEVLGTKAFLSARKDMFRTELIAALQIVQKGLVPRDAMRSSWAGALGQPQFLPTSFLKHAVDFDGDGRADIWTSTSDTLASIASYLRAYGWKAGRPWGLEVAAPDAASCALEGPDRPKRVDAWEKLGVRRADGRAFAPAQKRQDARLLMPAGRNGPAFLVSENFYVLKEYNESDLYALFIGHAADRIAGGGAGFEGAWTPVDGLTRADVAALQRALEAKGYDVGGADGLPGFKTRRSIGDWQAKTGLRPTCYPSRALVEALN